MKKSKIKDADLISEKLRLAIQELETARHCVVWWDNPKKASANIVLAGLYMLEAQHLLNFEQEVQVCDATKDDSSNAA
jgi:hypothetical protein